jgi:hypothetical protein
MERREGDDSDYAYISEKQNNQFSISLKDGEELRQRILYIVLLIVVVLVGYTILRPKPKVKSKVLTSEKPASTVKAPSTATPKVVTNVTKAEAKPETTLKAKIALDTSRPKAVAETPKPIKPDTSKVEISKKPDTTKLKASRTPVSQPVPEENVVKWGTDPFIRDWVLATEIRDLKLKAVTISGMKAYALINDQILERGEVIMGKRIVNIEKEKVILEQGGRQFTLFLGE